jgi:MazG family protein
VTDATRIVLVESAPGAPGLLGHAGWQALTSAELVLLRDPERHPAAPYLAGADIGTAPIPSDTFRVRDRQDLLVRGAGDVSDRKLAMGLCSAAEDGGAPVTVLLGPGDEQLGRAVGLEAARRHVEVEWVFLAELPAGGELLRLVEIERRLRDPEHGCPWDLEQDHASLARYLVEETYEALEAIASGDDEAIVEELGDVLLQVVFHAQLGHDRRAFTIDDIARGIADKLVNRHPHVFGDVDVADADEVVANWDELKQAEKPERDGPFDGVPTAQPALPLTAKLLSRARKQGVAWPDAAAAAAKVREELDEVLAVAPDDDAARTAEVGDLLHAVTALAGTLDVDPELALRGAALRFRQRVEGALSLARTRDLDFAGLSVEARVALLDEARARFVD